MCSIITVRSAPGDLTRLFDELSDPEGIDRTSLDLRVHGFLKREWAPVIFVDSSGRTAVRQKFFSLCPDWAKEWPFPFETYNARLTRPKRVKNPATGQWENQRTRAGEPVEETIAEVPSFRRAFKAGQTCLVPISDAIESCYFGLSAGKIVRFSQKSGGVFLAAGLWNDWFNPLSGEFVPTFTLLTDAPDSEIFAHGHDRGLVLLERSRWSEWLGKKMMPDDRLSFLRENRIQLEWQVSTERELKSGWEKRAPNKNEIDNIVVWSGRALG